MEHTKELGTLVYLSNDDILRAVNFAYHTVNSHIERMEHEFLSHLDRIVIGKLGEIAVGRYCEMMNISAEVNFSITSGIDRADLVILDKTVEVKTKHKTQCDSGFDINLEGWFLHIPVDQWDKKMQCDLLVAVVIELASSLWKELITIPSHIIGAISLKKYDREKVLHITGTELAPGFYLPPPNSYGVPYSSLTDIKEVFRFMLRDSRKEE
jgi:hypothetical protein